MNLYPLDDRLIKEIKDNSRNVRNTSLTNQPELGDTYSLNPGSYTYNASNIIQTTASEILRWSKGDRMYLRQSSSDKYFNVVGVDTVNYRLAVTAGNVYTFTNNVVQSISRYIRPVGGNFPTEFTWNPALSTVSGSISGITYVVRDFSILGDLVTCFLDAQFTIGGGGTNEVIVQLPTPGADYGGAGSWYAGNFLAVVSLTPEAAYSAFFSAGDTDEVGVYPIYTIFDGSDCAISGQIIYKLI